MGQRNMLYQSPMIDVDMDQHAHLHSEPCVPYGSITNFPQSNGHSMLPTNFDSHHLPENHGPVPYGLTQNNGIEHHHPGGTMDLTYMTPSSRIFPVQLNHGPHDPLSFSNNHGGFEVSADSYVRNSHFIDGFGGPFKRKNAEGIPGNFQYFYPSVGSSSSVAVPMSMRPLESDITMMDSASFAIGEYRGNDVQSVMEAGPHRSVRNRSGATGFDAVLGHNGNHLMQGNYVSRPLQAVSTPWLDQQFCSNGGDAGTFSWNQAPGLPYMQGCISGSGLEANMGVQGYQLSAGNRNPTAFVHPPIAPQGHHNLHHLPPPPPMHGSRGHDMDFHSQVAAAPRRLSANSTLYAGVNPFQNGVDPGPRFVGPTPLTGLRMHRPHRRDVMLDSSVRHRNLPHLRVLPEDGVAILDVSEYHEVGHSIDHHRDMRLDIDHMSYEELLALGEQIGSVGSGLSDDFIVNHLKVSSFVPASCSHLEGAASVDPELNFCVICQTGYENQENIGILNCGHEYHADCIKKWLIVKNTCPICKSAALASEKMES